ncbi:acyl-CoA dehydrogenase [Edaphosphingomonas haloaromaticamans]|uniref:3-methylmercaptopropionyl-CoA dehydrogenase n=1 Tax=Edaphosphingomonas haloaromaticamans TaxID=653954 RepID=A0A1S1HFU0_9SPHN|nr:acyl-CoA dehydrogenase [Sphingomonas haloaromaticamans]OHT20366.1 Acyl-CoA dehydrogenase, short-chain specific [Sphingomonas haloaromaticamans]
MTFIPVVSEQRFLMRHIVGIEELQAKDRFAAATPDVVDAILEGAGAFAAGEFAPLNRPGDVTGAKWTPEGVKMPAGFHEAYRAYVEGGWGTLAADPEHGGQGLPFALATAVLEDLGTANMGFSLIMMLTPGAVEALTSHGSPEQQAAWLPRLVTGEWNGTMNLTEPQAGSDVGALRSMATPAGDGSWRIKGTKIFITFGDHDLTDNIVHLVLARTPGAPAGTRGISLFLVPKFRLDGTPNDVRCVSIEHKMGIHASPTCVLSFGDGDDCHGWLIGPENGGMRAMFTMMNNARLNVGLQGVSIAERATQQAVAYARERIQSARAGAASRDSVAIIEHPDVRRMLLRMKAQTMAARALIYYAAGQVDRAHAGDEAAQARVDLLTPLAKAYGTDVGCEVSSLGVQVHGGMGFIEETGAAQHYRDARIAPIYEGTNGIQAADLVGRKLSMENGAVFSALLADIRAEAADEGALMALVDACELVGARLLAAGADDRLAGSYPFLTMLSVAVSGWLMARQERAARTEQGMDADFLALKQAAARFYLDRIVPEAAGLAAAATAGAEGLYGISAEAFSA